MSSKEVDFLVEDLWLSIKLSFYLSLGILVTYAVLGLYHPLTNPLCRDHLIGIANK